MKRQQTNPPFIRVPHATYDSPAFRSLRPIEVAVLLLVTSKFNGHNNGALPLGVREAARRCHCGQSTAHRALTRLQETGLITLTYRGHRVPEPGRPDAPTRWRVSFLENVHERKLHVVS
jgi:IclR helix-turn-helix domain